MPRDEVTPVRVFGFFCYRDGWHLVIPPRKLTPKQFT